MLRQRGIEVYDCDAAAKRLMATSLKLKEALCRLVGDDVYKEGRLQKAVMAKFLLESLAHKQAVNDIVHPAVAEDFQQSGLDWMECAIYFDSGFNLRVNMDLAVCVVAPLEVRVERIMKRDSLTREKALEWVNKQMSQEDVMARSDYRIVNDGKMELEPQIDRMLGYIGSLPIII